MKTSRVLTFIFFIFALLIIVYSLPYSEKARFGPLLIGIPAVILIITQIARESIIKRSMPEGRKAPEVSNSSDTGFRKNYLSYVEIAACLIGLLALIYIFGILIGFALFILAYLKLHKERWPLSIGMGLGIPALMYGIFEFGMKMALYKGILF